jgi:DNA polymerase I
VTQIQSPPAPRLALLDGHGIIFRAFFAQKDNPLSVRRTGELTSAVFGFANTLLKVIADLRPTHIAVTLDRSAPTFRHQADAAYKANRAAMPDELRPQIARVRQLIEAFNIPIFEADDYEADDMLGTLARQAAEHEIETYLVTLDSDIVQLVRPPVSVYMYRPYQRDTVIYATPEQVQERYGVRPDQIPDLKALKGDTSDNIPGVPGIGEKTAVKLLNQFEHVETIYEYLWQVSPLKLQEALRTHEQQARHSKHMATIVCDVPVEFDLDRCRVNDYHREQVVDLFRELEFRSLLPRLPEVDAAFAPESSAAPAVEQRPCVYTPIRTVEALDEVIARARAAGRIAVDTETTSQSAMRARLVGIALAVEPYEGYYVPVGHAAEDDPGQLPLATVIERLAPLLADPTVAKLGHNLKYDMIVLANAGAPLAGIGQDTMIAAYLLGESQIGLKALAFSELGVEMTPITELIGTGRKQITMDQVAVDTASSYACADVDMTLRLAAVLEPKLREAGLSDLYERIELPLVPVLVAMERRGVALDTDVLREMSLTLADDLKRFEREMYDLVGHEFNINSPRQLGQVLFDELNLPKTRKTATGYSTDAQALESLRGTHPVVDKLFEYRQVSKLKSTYVDALPGMINPDTGRVHTNYNQTRAATGRLSSEDPNLQNIPIRTELGRGVRRAFVARDGGEPRLFLAADYSQVELRILAHLSKEPFLIDAFLKDLDVHRATAGRLYGIAPEQVTGEQRAYAKMVNFATIYGLSAAGLAMRSEMSRQEAAAFINGYFAQLPRVKEYLDGTIAFVRSHGYAETLLGRRRYFSDINSANFNLRQAAERQAINHPVQGTNADIIKLAMIELLRELDLRRMRSRMILQVHDELIFECPPDELDAVREMAERIMPAAMTLDVPLKVEVKTGRNWGEME